MAAITAKTTLEELAALVSQALARAGIPATLSGGSAVSLYTDNEYPSEDLDFVSSGRLKEIDVVVEPLGFRRTGGARQYEHHATRWFLEFPPGPIAFGDTSFGDDEAAILETAFGPLRIVTPTQIVMDRVAAYEHWHDNQSLDQAAALVRHQRIDWPALRQWAAREGIDAAILDDLRSRAG